MKRITFDVTEDLHQWLYEKSSREGLTISSYIRRKLMLDFTAEQENANQGGKDE